MIVVDVDMSHGFTAGRPRRLFSGPYPRPTPIRGYDVSPDGRRFIMIKPVEEEEKRPDMIEIVLNWTEDLKAHMLPR